MYIDSHAHVFVAEYPNDRDEVLQRAFDAGVEAIVVPATNVRTSHEAIELAERYERVYACVGIHPHEAAKAAPEDLHSIEGLSHLRKVVAIGEIGLDYYYDFAPRGLQREVFQRQIELARRRNLPIVVHTRDSIGDAINIVEEAVKAGPDWRSNLANVYSRYPPPRGVFHCFTGTADEAARLFELGFYVSFPGIVTFRNSPVKRTLLQIGFDHILLETDSPYMAPVPHRGTRNEPANVPLIAHRIAELFQYSVEDVARTTRFNAKRLFGIGPPDPPQIVYALRNSLYLNITIRCNADCFFCDRKGDAVVKGHNLRIEHEPTVKELAEAIGDPTKYDEIVFCGYGEPTIRLDVVKEVAKWVKERGGKVRLNTDGHGNVINKRNIVPELVGLVDSVSISFNTADPRQYGEMMNIDGERFHREMVEFARECARHLPEVVMTVVDVPGVDIEAAREFVEKKIGVKLNVRPFF